MTTYETQVEVIALVVDNDNLTFYKPDGSTLVVTQGDPNGADLTQQYFDQKRLGHKTMTLVLNNKRQTTVTHLNSPKRNKLIRYFRAKIKDIKKLFDHSVRSEEEMDPSLVDTHESAVLKVQELAAKIMAQKGNDIISDSSLPLKRVDDESEMETDETIVAVTDAGIVPHVESLTDQFQAGDEGKASATGAEALIMRLAAMSAKRGHTSRELMKFIEKIDLPILPDGSFLAYKRLRHVGNGVYVDPHSGKVKQRIGDIVQMDEKLVDPSRRQECSQGLHVGTRHYMGGFHANVEGSGTMLVLIQPEDAIAVPEREAAKMRACRYLILADLSNKAHGLVNQNKRMDDCKETMQIVAQIVAGARPPLLGVVNIAGTYGAGLSYTINGQSVSTDISLKDARDFAGSKAQAPSAKVAPVRTIDEEKNGNKAGILPQKVRDKTAHGLKPADALAKAKASAPEAQPTRIKVAVEYYAVMTDGACSDADRRKAALALKKHKQGCKVSYAALGLPKETGTEVEEILDIVPAKVEPKPSEPTPAPAKKQPVSKKTAPQPTKVDPKAKAKEDRKKAKAEAPKAPVRESRGDKARRLWTDVTNGDLSATRRKEAAHQLRTFKKTAKVGWNALGLGNYNVEGTLAKLLD